MSRSLRAVAVLSFVLAAWMGLATQSVAQDWTSPTGCPDGQMLIFNAGVNPGVYECAPEDTVLLEQLSMSCSGEYIITVPVSSEYGWSADPICFPIYEEGLNGGWYDTLGNLVPSQGECPAGYFVWESPANGLDHAICSEESEDVSGPVEVPAETPIPSDKGVYEVIGPAYVVGTNGEGVVCRDAPNGTPVITLLEGTEVMELADGVSDGWQMVAYQESETVFPSCFVWAEYLTNAPKDSDVYESGTDSGSTDSQTLVEPTEDEPAVTVTESPVNGPVEADATTEATTNAVVTSLPNTGTGTADQHLITGETQPTLTTEQRQWAIAIAVLCGIGLVVGLIMTRPSEPPFDRW